MCSTSMEITVASVYVAVSVRPANIFIQWAGTFDSRVALKIVHNTCLQANSLSDFSPVLGSQ